jgi:hypothetical protein
MSLLLDALKKAADDKQKASQTSSTGKQQAETTVDSLRLETQPASEELSLQGMDDSQKTSEALSVNNTDKPEELILDIDESDSDDQNQNNPALTEKTFTNDGGAEKKESDDLSDHQADEEKAELSLQQNKKDNNSDGEAFTVSDEALSMLIHKTNRDVTKGNRIIFASVLSATLVIIIAGGIYYYQDMQTEVVALERKHQIAMMAMKSKTSGERSPENTEIIRTLVSDTDIDDKVKYAKKHIANKNNSKQVQSRSEIIPEKKTRDIKAAKQVMSIQKTKKQDPVGEKLDAAWLAYENAQYDKAKKLYKDVLIIEASNRDAMLGMGAIAILEKDNIMAQEFYLALLKQDPRDPVATAALASLHNDESSLKVNEERLLSMLQNNPNAAHLNFVLGNIYAQQNKWKSAQLSYFNAWQHDGNNADYIFNLAVSMDQLGKQQQAINFYKDSLHKSVNKQVSFSRDAVQKRINDLSEK